MDVSICSFTPDIFNSLRYFPDQQSSFLNCITNDHHKRICFSENCYSKQKTYSDYYLNYCPR